jgi:hypothetical protein
MQSGTTSITLLDGPNIFAGHMMYGSGADSGLRLLSGEHVHGTGNFPKR